MVVVEVTSPQCDLLFMCHALLTPASDEFKGYDMLHFAVAPNDLWFFLECIVTLTI